jgi:predicted RNA methylase
MFFQSAKEMTGRRFPQWAGNVMRQESSYLQRNYTAHGFSLLDEFLFSTGRYEFHIPRSDGWHFGGTKRQMEVIALFNMICNDWLKTQGKN